MTISIFDLRPVDGRKSFYGKAQVVRFGDWYYLRSYNTFVCAIDSNGNFHRFWRGYSVTTMRHINAFIDAFGIPGGGKMWWSDLPISDAFDERVILV